MPGQEEEIYHEAHIREECHSGITRTCERIRQNVYWPGVQAFCLDKGKEFLLKKSFDFDEKRQYD